MTAYNEENPPSVSPQGGFMNAPTFREAGMSTGDYSEFLVSKTQLAGQFGFTPNWLPDFLFDFQRDLMEWAIKKGRAAIFAECGLGKTAMQLAWAANIVRHTNGRVLILTPLAVGAQTVLEAAKFGLEALQLRTAANLPKGIVVANYERLHLFDPKDFAGVVADESSIIKHWSGATQKAVTRFLSKLPYRLLCTATPSPNDFIELGTSSEALGELTHSDMLGIFFRQLRDDEKKLRATAFDIIHSRRLSWRVIQSFGQWVLKPHSFEPFWRWVSSWARACRRPSDMGAYDDSKFVLPPLNRVDYTVESPPPPGHLFSIPAIGLNQERGERRRTAKPRAELVADLTRDSDSAVVWCHMNDEADFVEKEVKGAVQVKGTQTIDQKEELILAFLSGQARVLVTKPKIAGLGLNLQHCAHVVTFPTHSYEQFHQCVRRCWRFGQKRPVRLDIIATEGEENVIRRLNRKEEQAKTMFDSVVRFMNDSLNVNSNQTTQTARIPSWLREIK